MDFIPVSEEKNIFEFERMKYFKMSFNSMLE